MCLSRNLSNARRIIKYLIVCNVGVRARELFEALDDDGNGVLTEDEFVQVQVHKNVQVHLAGNVD